VSLVVLVDVYYLVMAVVLVLIAGFGLPPNFLKPKPVGE
jgi:hypothetical protein